MLEKIAADERQYLIALIQSQTYAWVTLMQLMEEAEIPMKGGGTFKSKLMLDRLTRLLKVLKENTAVAGVPEHLRPDFIVLQNLIDCFEAQQPGGMPMRMDA